MNKQSVPIQAAVKHSDTTTEWHSSNVQCWGPDGSEMQMIFQSADAIPDCIVVKIPRREVMQLCAELMNWLRDTYSTDQ